MAGTDWDSTFGKTGSNNRLRLNLLQSRAEALQACLGLGSLMVESSTLGLLLGYLHAQLLFRRRSHWKSQLWLQSWEKSGHFAIHCPVDYPLI